ncbi:hypothetical protein [Tahibacter harae]|uniref:Uncharacterized protein n=1 Tax=Tahibacter harae TaxID=2963937 RepID=A0ABT1QM09_9GAMM|nr:hypothetical protein [Tahibacter harae]MCQ4163559.1 hypothetical protein [Tahibacter harae]
MPDLHPGGIAQPARIGRLRIREIRGSTAATLAEFAIPESPGPGGALPSPSHCRRGSAGRGNSLSVPQNPDTVLTVRTHKNGVRPGADFTDALRSQTSALEVSHEAVSRYDVEDHPVGFVAAMLQAAASAGMTARSVMHSAFTALERFVFSVDGETCATAATGRRFRHIGIPRVFLGS